MIARGGRSGEVSIGGAAALARARDWLRSLAGYDVVAVALYAGVALITTYPLVGMLADGFPGRADILAAHWQNWWLRQVIREGYNPAYTPYLFHPRGLDVTLQPRRWLGMVTWLPLSALFGEVAAYNVNALLGLVVSAYVMYRLVQYLTQNRVAAWMGGLMFGFYPQHVVRALGQPNTGSIQWMPAVLLPTAVLLDRLVEAGQAQKHLTREMALLVAGAAIAGALNAYVNFKIWVMAAFVCGLYGAGMALARGLWRRLAFWEAVGALAVLSLLLALPIYLPYLRTDYLDSAISEYWDGRGIDLVGVIMLAPGKWPLTPGLVGLLSGATPPNGWEDGPFYLGMLSIVCVGVALVDAVRQKRSRLVWFGMALVLWGLALGVPLSVNGVSYPDVPTPYYYLQEVPLFRAMREPHRFTLAMSLPWAVLVGYGVSGLWERLAARPAWARGAAAAIGAGLVVELAFVPLDIYRLNVPDFYRQLGRGGWEAGALIELPMGRDYSKYYMYVQTIHGQPILEGMSARMPPEAYDYIEGNALLHAWREVEEPECADVQPAVTQLLDDGFRYVIVRDGSHNSDLPPRVTGDDFTVAFDGVSPVFADGLIRVYQVEDMKALTACKH